MKESHALRCTQYCYSVTSLTLTHCILLGWQTFHPLFHSCLHFRCPALYRLYLFVHKHMEPGCTILTLQVSSIKLATTSWLRYSTTGAKALYSKPYSFKPSGNGGNKKRTNTQAENNNRPHSSVLSSGRQLCLKFSGIPCSFYVACISPD